MKGFDHNSGEYLKAGDAKIYFEVNGNDDDPVLLFLHGGFGNIEDFNDIIADLDNEYKVVGIDSRGQGKSTRGSEPLSYKLLRQDAEKVLVHLNIDALTILGFSDGGIVAYRLAGFTQLKIKKLVTIGSRWHLKNAMATKEILSKITGDSWKEKYPSIYVDYLRLNPEPVFNELARQLVKMWLDTGTSGYPNEVVKNISCPLLIIRGENDPIISGNDTIELSGLVKNSRILNIPSAGHMAFKDQHKVFMKSLNEFLEEKINKRIW